MGCIDNTPKSADKAADILFPLVETKKKASKHLKFNILHANFSAEVIPEYLQY